MRIRKIRVTYQSWNDAIRDIASIINEEPTFSMTLQSGTASTVISNSLAGKDSVITFTPITANAAIDMNSMYISARGNKSFTITHVNNGNGDRTFMYTIYG